MPIEHISDTARWVAVYRAMESERPDAHFHDPYARKLAGSLGEEIVESLPGGKGLAWAMVVRTQVFDEMIMDAVNGKQVDTVLNLAAGLDARPWRLPLPAALRWIDVDLPDILNYKSDALTGEMPKCRYETVTIDLRDEAKRQALFTRLGAESARTLVVTEGLLIYLTAGQVGALATDLNAQASFRWWLIDLANPWLLDYMNKRWGRTTAAGNAPFQFAPAESSAFFERFGWKELVFRSMGEEGRRLHREMSMMWLWRLMSRFWPAEQREQFKRTSGTVLLERM